MSHSRLMKLKQSLGQRHSAVMDFSDLEKEVSRESKISRGLEMIEVS